MRDDQNEQNERHEQHLEDVQVKQDEHMKLI